MTQLQDAALVAVLDAVDDRTAIQQRLHARLSDGFLRMARERYHDALAIHRLSQITAGTRETVASVRLAVLDSDAHPDPDPDPDPEAEAEAEAEAETISPPPTDGLRQRRGAPRVRPPMRIPATESESESGTAPASTTAGPSAGGMPSLELREATRDFAAAVDDVLLLVAASARVTRLVDSTMTSCQSTSGSDASL